MVIGIYGPLYYIRGSVFLKCDGEPKYKDRHPIIDDSICCKPDVEIRGDGIYYYKYLSNGKIIKNLENCKMSHRLLMKHKTVYKNDMSGLKPISMNFSHNFN